jgi:phage protein D
MTDRYVPSFKIEVEGESLVHGSTIDVLSVSVTEAIESADTFTFSIRSRRNESGRFASGSDLLWIDNDDFQEGKNVKIEMGYVGNMREMIQGKITSVTPNFPQSGIPTILINGQSRNDRLTRERRREPFTKSKASDIALEIADQVGLTPKVDPTDIEYAYRGNNDNSLMDILKDIAGRIGYEVFVKGDTLYFVKPGNRSNPSPALELEWGRNLQTFKPKLKTHGLHTEVTVRASQTSQGGAKQPLVGTAKAGDERGKLGDKSASQYIEENLAKSSFLHREHNITSQEEAKEMALAKLEESSMNYITGSGSCIGTVELEPRVVIEIKSVGSRFSGKYYVTKVIHTIDGSGYRSTFEVKRNAR